jgi:hypothetical protein
MTPYIRAKKLSKSRADRNKKGIKRTALRAVNI